jgi:phage terminase small subunit
VSELNPRQRAFVNAYLGEANGNATKAAISAGYSERSARSVASQIMARTDIQQAIAGRLEKHDLATDAVLKRFGRIVHSEPESAPTHQDIIAAGKVILQVNGALQAKPQANTGVTVNIGFLTAPGAPMLLTHSNNPMSSAIDVAATSVKELTQQPQLVPSEG